MHLPSSGTAAASPTVKAKVGVGNANAASATGGEVRVYDADAGEELTIRLSRPDEAVRALKDELESATGIEAAKQIIVFCGRALKEDDAVPALAAVRPEEDDDLGLPLNQLYLINTDSLGVARTGSAAEAETTSTASTIRQRRTVQNGEEGERASEDTDDESGSHLDVSCSRESTTKADGPIDLQNSPCSVDLPSDAAADEPCFRDSQPQEVTDTDHDYIDIEDCFDSFREVRKEDLLGPTSERFQDDGTKKEERPLKTKTWHGGEVAMYILRDAEERVAGWMKEISQEVKEAKDWGGLVSRRKMSQILSSYVDDDSIKEIFVNSDKYMAYHKLVCHKTWMGVILKEAPKVLLRVDQEEQRRMEVERRIVNKSKRCWKDDDSKE